MNLYFTCVMLTALGSFCTASPFTDCGSTTGQVSSVEVKDCPDGQDVCILEKGKDAEIKINFISQTDSKTMKTVVHGVIAGIPIPFPIPQPDACKTGVACPVQSGKSYTYDNMLTVRNSYPPVSVEVKFELVDDKKQDVVCVEIPCKIQ